MMLYCFLKKRYYGFKPVITAHVFELIFILSKLSLLNDDCIFKEYV